MQPVDPYSGASTVHYQDEALLQGRPFLHGIV
jgi:hypothetical protein